MRVALDATPLLGPRTGIGTYTAHLIDRLARRSDLDLVITAFTARGASGLADALPPGVRVSGRRVPARLLRAAWLAGWGPTGEALTGRVEIFHATNYVLPPLRRAAGVLSIHDLGYLRNPSTVTRASLAYRHLVPMALRRGATVCTLTRAVAEQVTDAYAVPADRVHVASPGVESAWHEAVPPTEATRTRLGLPTDYLVAVGTLEPRKNLTGLLDAYRLAESRHLDLPPLVLVGAAGWGPDLDTSGIRDDLVLRSGHIPFDELRQVVAGARALVFPSIDEGFGLPPVEALACGTPVVVADLPVTREVLGDQACYADPRSSEALLEAMTATLRTPVGTDASRRAKASEYTWERCADATVTAYRSALDG